MQTYKFLLSHGASLGDEECKYVRRYTYSDPVLVMPILLLYSPLCLAAMQASYPEFVQLLLDRGADPNATDTELGTPLFCACKANNPAAASILLKASMAYKSFFTTVNMHVYTFIEADHSVPNAQGMHVQYMK